MFFWIIENDKFVLYERIGECLGCGKCCQGNLITAQTTISESNNNGVDESVDLSLADWNGYSVFKLSDVWRWYKTKVTNEQRVCESLNGNKCDCWQTDEWPEFCKYWPFHPRDIIPFPNCGFSFERKDNS